jgi:hypothetical protein
LFSILLIGPSCGSGGSSEKPPAVDELIYDCENRPSGISTLATDESFMAIVNAEAARGLTRDDGKAPALSAPAAGSRLSVTAPPRFEWRATLASAARAAPFDGCRREAPRRRGWSEALRALSPVGVAHAHCEAVTGENFVFRLEAAGRPLYTAILSVTAFTPDAAKWSKATGGHVGESVTLTLARAYLAQGAVIEGPYVGAPVTFTLER